MPEKNDYESKILEHYRKEAAAVGASKESTLRDHFTRDAETRFIMSQLARTGVQDAAGRVLEYGSGNGYTMSVLAPAFPAVGFTGVEFTPELLAIAAERKLDNVEFMSGDCRAETFPDDAFNVIITQRVLINLLDEAEQKKALANIFRTLKPGGFYIAIESFREPFECLNAARAELDLPPVPMPVHNLYFETEDFLTYTQSLGFVFAETEMPANYLSTHYFVGRVLHEVVRPEGGTFRNTLFVDFFDNALPPGVGDFAPIKFYCLEKPAV